MACLSLLSFPLLALRDVEREKEDESETEGERAGETQQGSNSATNPAPLRQFLEFTVTTGEPVVHLAASQIPPF